MLHSYGEKMYICDNVTESSTCLLYLVWQIMKFQEHTPFLWFENIKDSLFVRCKCVLFMNSVGRIRSNAELRFSQLKCWVSWKFKFHVPDDEHLNFFFFHKNLILPNMTKRLKKLKVYLFWNFGCMIGLTLPGHL